jgi:hypothetical protein
MLLGVPLFFKTTQHAFEIQDWLAQGSGAEAVQVAFDPSQGWPGPNYEYGGNQTLIHAYVPIRLNSHPDLPTRIDYVEARVDDRQVGANSPKMLAPGDHSLTFQDVHFPGKIEKSLLSGVALKLTYFMTTFRRVPGPSFTAAAGLHEVSGLGRCENDVAENGGAITAECLMDSGRPSCFSVDVTNAPGTKRITVNQYRYTFQDFYSFQDGLICAPDYSPVKTKWGLENLSPRVLTFFFSFPGQHDHPVPTSQQRIVTTVYEPAAHFQRHVVILNFRIKGEIRPAPMDWRGNR